MRLILKKYRGKIPSLGMTGKKVCELWGKSDRITINFANLLIASVSFMDEAFGHLALEFPQDELKRKLAFMDMKEYDRALLNDILLSRIRERNLSARKTQRRRRSYKKRTRN